MSYHETHIGTYWTNSKQAIILGFFYWNYCILVRSFWIHVVNRLLDVELHVLDRSVIRGLLRLLLLLLLLQTEEGETAGLQVGCQLGMVVEHRVEIFLEGQGGFVLLHVLDFGIIVEFEVIHERVQKLGGESSVAVHVHHEGMETLHLRVVTGEVVSLLFTFERDITGSFFFGLGPAGDFLMVNLQFSDGPYLVFNLWEMFCGHF